MENGGGGQRLGCPACGFVGRTCPPNCPLSVYFPAETESDLARIKALRNVFDELRAYATAQLRFTKAEPIVSAESTDEEPESIHDYGYDADGDFSAMEDLESDFLARGIESLALKDSLEDDDQELPEPSGHACASYERGGRRECPPDCLFAQHFPAGGAEDYARVEKLLGVETLTKVLKFLSHEAKTLADRPAGKFIKVITNNIVSEIESVAKALEDKKADKFQDPQEESALMEDEKADEFRDPDQEETPLEGVVVNELVDSESSASERAFRGGEKREVSTADIDLRLVETPSPKDEECLSPRSPLEMAIIELHNLIARQEEEEELGNCETESLITHSPRSVS